MTVGRLSLSEGLCSGGARSAEVTWVRLAVSLIWLKASMVLGSHIRLARCAPCRLVACPIDGGDA